MESNRIFKVNSTLYFKNLENSKVDGLYNEIILPLRTEVLRYLDLVDLKDNLDLSNDNIGLCIDYADKEGRMFAKYYLTDGVQK